MPEILMAWDAKVHFIQMTNPNGPPTPTPSKEAAAKEARMGFRVAAMSRKKD